MLSVASSSSTAICALFLRFESDFLIVIRGQIRRTQTLRGKKNPKWLEFFFEKKCNCTIVRYDFLRRLEAVKTVNSHQVMVLQRVYFSYFFAGHDSYSRN